MICPKCEEDKKLTPKNWVRCSRNESGFDTRQCKDCYNLRAAKYRKSTSGLTFAEIAGIKERFGWKP